MLIFEAAGRGADDAFSQEAGGHRWQRVPPTERRGRVHTSTVTVAVLREPTTAEVVIGKCDIDRKTCRGSGAGGQHRNMTDSAVQLTHIPTGITVRAESERSQKQNEATAYKILRARILDAEQRRLSARRATERREQVGSGMRGDKRRTIALQRGQVTDHVTGKQIRVQDYLKGQIEGLR